jgi:hypothetical protein
MEANGGSWTARDAALSMRCGSNLALILPKEKTSGLEMKQWPLAVGFLGFRSQKPDFQELRDSSR